MKKKGKEEVAGVCYCLGGALLEIEGQESDEAATI